MEAWGILQIVLGIGLVIFVHESGHFIAARLCKVRVEVFSLGFGPRIFGWKRGATQYQVAAVPLGGYVKMAGDDTWLEERDPAPDTLGAKSVGQRFFIFSGGVLANVAFGLVVFPFLFHFGVPFNEPMIGDPLPGGPAWHAQLEPGTRVLSINGKRVYSFMHIPNEVALGPADECVLELLPPGESEPRIVRLVPEYSELDGVYTIGVWSATDPAQTLAIEPGSPAERAGLATGDRLLAVAGGLDGRPIWDQCRSVMADGAPLRLTYERDGRPAETEIVPVPSEEAAYDRIGVGAPSNLIADVRRTPRTTGLDLQAGDRIRAAGARRVYDVDDLLAGLIAAENGPELTVEREGELRTLSLPRLSEAAAVALVSDLYVQQDRESTVLSVSPGEPGALAGLRDGDRVVRIDGAEIENYDDIVERSKAAAAAGRPMRMAVMRADPASGETRALEIVVEPAPWHQPWYGFGPRPASYVYKVDNPVEAIQVGMLSCWKFLQDTWLTLKGMMASKVSPKNLGGPIAISFYAYRWAEEGWTKLFFFLCILSINLAFINVLPIPLLDGGHLFFLIIEKIKGSPVSERVMSYSQLVGLVLIVSLFVFVIYNDVQRHILG